MRTRPEISNALKQFARQELLMMLGLAALFAVFWIVIDVFLDAFEHVHNSYDVRFLLEVAFMWTYLLSIFSEACAIEKSRKLLLNDYIKLTVYIFLFTMPFSLFCAMYLNYIDVPVPAVVIAAAITGIVLFFLRATDISVRTMGIIGLGPHIVALLLIAVFSNFSIAIAIMLIVGLLLAFTEKVPFLRWLRPPYRTILLIITIMPFSIVAAGMLLAEYSRFTYPSIRDFILCEAYPYKHGYIDYHSGIHKSFWGNYFCVPDGGTQKSHGDNHNTHDIIAIKDTEFETFNITNARIRFDRRFRVSIDRQRGVDTYYWYPPSTRLLRVTPVPHGAEVEFLGGQYLAVDGVMYYGAHKAEADIDVTTFEYMAPRCGRDAQHTYYQGHIAHREEIMECEERMRSMQESLAGRSVT